MYRTQLPILIVMAIGLVPGEPARATNIPAELAKAGELKVGIRCEAPPSGFLDEHGRPAGIDVDFARHIAELTFGSPDKAVFTCVTAASRVQMLLSKKVDLLIATLGVTDERKRAVDFATSMDWGSSGVLVRDKEDHYANLDAFKGKTLLTDKGSWQSAYLQAKYPDIHLVKYDSINDAIEALRQGRGDGLTQDLPTLVTAADKDPRLKVTNIVFQAGWSAPAVRRGDNDLRLYINTMVTRAKTDGTFVSSINKYTSGHSRELAIRAYTTMAPDGSTDQNAPLPPR